MSWYAVSVDYELEYDDETFPPHAHAHETGAFEAVDAKTACRDAREALRPYGSQWEAVAWEAVECADRDDAGRIALKMERWYWRAE